MTRPALAFALAALAVAAADARPVPDPVAVKVGELKRHAVIVPPTKGKKAAHPVVFVFHGHGGTSADAASGFAIHEHWPEAVVVYPQGVKTPRPSDPEGKFSGWQGDPADYGGRDLLFFDALLAKVTAEHKVDDKRVYAAGFSNGGSFTYLLWANRGAKLAAVGPVGATAGKQRKGLTPKPCLHVAGEKDDVVEFANQQKSMAAVREVNGCTADGKRWDKAGPLVGTVYESKGGTPFVGVVHPGGHTVPPEVGPLLVRFFKENPGK